LKLNAIHQHLVYADDANSLGANINTRKETEALLIASKEDGLQEETLKNSVRVLDSRTEYMEKSQ
jgi:hypothetical protein